MCFIGELVITNLAADIPASTYSSVCLSNEEEKCEETGLNVELLMRISCDLGSHVAYTSTNVSYLFYINKFLGTLRRNQYEKR